MERETALDPWVLQAGYGWIILQIILNVVLIAVLAANFAS